MPIRVLSPQVAAAIAAGEVIERPASVVKELLENAIDAGARTVRIEVERGGLERIRVVDDGCGIPPDEIEVAFQRHATSKLISDTDLERLRTLGFRGEALPSIVAAADVELSSRTSDGSAGATARYRDGALAARLPFTGAPGTTVAVRHLFARQPARLKFLRSAASEANAIAAAVQPYAIAYPGMRVSLTIDGRTVLQTAGNGDLRDAVTRVLGAETAATLLEIGPRAGEDEHGVRVRGLAGPPSLSRATRTGITILVNRRWVQPRRLAVAVEQAYDTLLPIGRHPVAVIEIAVSPAGVDVNVHPTKAEVRFRDERAVFGAVLHALRGTLGPAAPVAEFGLRAQNLFSTSGAMPIAAAAPPIGPVPLDGAPPTQSPLWQTLLRPEEHDHPLAAGHAPAPGAPRLPLLRVVGQTGGTYVVAEGPTGMYLIDQHAAHERVLYERIRAQRAAAGVEVQGLLAPASVEMTAQQAASYAAYGALLAAYGFECEPFGERAVMLRSAPAVLAGRDAGRALGDLLDALAEERAAPDDDRLVKTLACHGSVRAGKTLNIDEMRELVLLLEGCDAPRTCPHGRPTMVHLSAAALEREFRRR